MQITRRNALNGELETRDVDITPEEWHRFLMGEALQKVAPQLSVNDRRFIIYGVNEHQYADMFS